MSRPVTDRERALLAEARVAELEDELRAYRDEARCGSETEDVALRVAALQRRLRDLTGLNDSRGVAKFLLFMLERPGRLATREAIFHAVARSEDTQIKVVDVRASRARSALRAIGFPKALITIWGQGYVLAADAADPVRRTLGLAA